MPDAETEGRISGSPFPECGLYTGKVMHSRLVAPKLRFTYRVFYLLLDVDRLPDWGRRLRLFGYNRWGLLGHRDRDHGPRDGSSLRPWLEAHLAEAGLDGREMRFFILAMPRLLGYVFNPLSLYYCYRPDGRLAAILYEVKNTFGDQHGYLLKVDGEDGTIRQGCDKAFYVSPFLDMKMHYRFRLTTPADSLAVLISETDRRDGTPVLAASLTAKRQALTDKALAGALLRHPLLTFKVIVGIHWEAARLWLRRAVFHRRPGPPQEAVSHPGPASGPGSSSLAEANG